MPLATGRVVRRRHAIPELHSWVIRRTSRDLDAVDDQFLRTGEDRPRREQGKGRKHECCQSSAHVTGIPFGTR